MKRTVMTAEVIMLPNAVCTEMPAPQEDNGAYVLELEQENLDLRDALASAVLRGRQGYRRTAIGLAVLSAFGAGWMLDPPFHLTDTARAQPAPAESLATEDYAHAPGSRPTPGEPRLRDPAPFYGYPV